MSIALLVGNTRGQAKAAAQWKDFYITSPYEKVSWVAGKTATITWDQIPGAGGPVDSIAIAVMDGPDHNAKVLQNVAEGLDASTTSYSWTVPPSFRPTDQVFVRLTGSNTANKDAEPVVRYSHRFTVVNNDVVPKAEKVTAETKAVVTKLVVVSETSTSTSKVSSSTTTISSTKKDHVIVASSAVSHVDYAFVASVIATTCIVLAVFFV